MSKASRHHKEQMKWEASRLQAQIAERRRLIETLQHYLKKDEQRLSEIMV
jgi:hypothetical protein